MRCLGWCLTCLLLGTACGVPPFNRAYVSRQLQERTGHGLAPVATGEEGAQREDSLVSGELTVDRAVSLALRNNPDFAAALEDLGVSRAQLRQASLPKNPLGFLGLEFFTGGLKPYFSALFPLELGGSLFFRRKIGKLQLEQTAERLVHVGLGLVAEVKTAHAELQALRAKRRLSRSALDVLERSARIARDRHEAGDISLQEVRLTEVELARARQEAMRLTHEEAIARERLDRLLGLDPSRSQWELTHELPADSGPELRIDEISERAAKQRLDLRVAELEVRVATERAGLEWSSVLPTLNLGVVGEKTTGNPLLIGPGFGLPLPLFDRNQAQIAKARAELRRAGHQYRAAKRQVLAEVRTFWERWRQAWRMTKGFREDLLPRLEQSVSMAEAAHQGGQESFLAVLWARRSLIETRAAEVESLLQARKARIELEKAVGGQLP